MREDKKCPPAQMSRGGLLDRSPSLRDIANNAAVDTAALSAALDSVELSTYFGLLHTITLRIHLFSTYFDLF